MPKRGFSAEPHAPLYRQVFESLAAEILSGKYKAGQKFPSEAALVQQFRTSRITVGRALRELTQRGLVKRIAGSGTFVLHAHPGDDGLVFGLLIPDLGHTEIFEPICRGIAAAPRAGRHALLWGHFEAGAAPTSQQALQLCDQFIARRVAGVFFATLETGADVLTTNLEIVARLEKAHIPIVLLDRCVMPYPHRLSHDLVGIDNRRAGYMAAEHLLRLGVKRISMVAYAGGASTIEARVAGFREAMQTYDLDAQVLRINEITEGILRPLLDQADAFVCANDRTAGQLMRVLLGLGYRIPGDVRVVGIDDVEYASLLPVPLTTVHQPCREIGETAMGAMLDRIERPGVLTRDILVECRLVVRDSCGARGAPGR